MNSKSLTFDEFLPMLATISKQQDPGSYEDFVEVRVLQHFMVLIFFELGTSPLSSGYRFRPNIAEKSSNLKKIPKIRNVPLRILPLRLP